MNISGNPTLPSSFIQQEVDNLVWATKTIVNSHALYGKDQFAKQGYYGRIASMVYQGLEADAMIELTKYYDKRYHKGGFEIRDYHSIIATFRNELAEMRLKEYKQTMLANFYIHKN